MTITKIIESVNSPLLKALKSSNPCSQISHKCIIAMLVAAKIDVYDENSSYKSYLSDESKFSVNIIEKDQVKIHLKIRTLSY